MSGWSISLRPNALRCAACQVASAALWRIPAAVAMAQSSRVWLTISMMVATPRPSSPTRWATASSNSISAEALERFPSLSFKRCKRIALRVPSGRTRGSRKQERPPGACARTKNASFIGAEQNHLCPRSVNEPSAVGVAAVVLARTSEPPCFSVIAMPMSTPALSPGGRSPGSYSVAVMRGSQTAARSGLARRAGTAA